MKNLACLLICFFLFLIPAFSQADTTQTEAEIIPLQVTSFDAKLIDRNVQLVWKVAGNAEAKSFEVEKEEGGVYRKIGSKLSLGRTGAETYEFVDALPKLTTDLVYRIKINPKEGPSLYSTVRSVKANEKALQARLKQNPVRAAIDVEVTAGTSGTLHATVLTAYGQTVLSETFKLSAGANNISFSVPDLFPGLHRLVLESGAERTLLSFVKE